MKYITTSSVDQTNNRFSQLQCMNTVTVLSSLSFIWLTEFIICIKNNHRVELVLTEHEKRKENRVENKYLFFKSYFFSNKYFIFNIILSKKKFHKSLILDNLQLKNTIV